MVQVEPTAKRIRVYLGGEPVVDTLGACLVWEDRPYPAYYVPLLYVRLELLRPSETVTMCPYKGTATFWSVQVGDRLVPDLVWTYRTPVVESVKIAGLACFFNEHVDLTVDGVQQERPVTAFS